MPSLFSDLEKQNREDDIRKIELNGFVGLKVLEK